MRTIALKTIAAASILGLGIGFASAQSGSTEWQRFEQQAVAVNRRAARSPQELAAALNTISVQTGVPLATVQAQHQQYPKTGVAGLMAANVLAAQTKQRPEVFLQAETAGQSWPQIAQAYKVPASTLNTGLANMEQTMGPTGQTAGAQPANTEWQRFEQQAVAVNQRAASSPQELAAALNAVSVQTGVPLARVQAQHQQYPKTGVAGLMAANVLADQTKQNPEVFLQAEAAGQTWSQIAQAYKVPVSKLNTRLANMERSMGTTGQTAGAQPANTEWQRFEQQAVAVNQRAASSPQELAAALNTISVQTGVPLATVQAQHQQYPKTGVAGLMAANVLADQTKQNPEVFLQAHAAGQTWSQIAQAYKVPVSKLNTRLANMEQRIAPTGR